MSTHTNAVSVIMPIYNSDKFLKKSIESVLNQTYQDIEIIAIDDGSTDKSKQILEDFSNDITLCSQTNQGLASALQTGINKMKGNWIKWFSPDDILYPHAIEELISNTKKLPQNTIVYSNWDIINEQGNILRSFKESDYNNLSNFEYNVRLLDGQQINVNTTLIPFSLIKQGCIFRKLNDPVAIDYDFFLRAGIIFNANFHLLHKSLIKYRMHSKQLSHNHITKTLSYLESVKDEILSSLDTNESEKYILALKNYQKLKPISKKTMIAGLKLTSHLPEWVSDGIIIYYLNKLRKTR